MTLPNNNPLRQYFRRPSIYIKLPSNGVGYSEGVIDMPENGELPVFPMTAIDEISARTPDSLYNGEAVYQIIKSCVPNILNPWVINSVDLDAILIGIKIASSGNDLKITSECPKCKEVNDYSVNLSGALQQLKPGAYDKPLPINELEIKFKPLSYREMTDISIKQFEVQRLFNSIENIENEEERVKQGQESLKIITELTMNVISLTIEYIKTPSMIVSEKEFIIDYLKNCDKKDYVTIRDYSNELKSATQMQPMDIKCPDCSNEYKQTIGINVSDFFE
jgi:phage FluMu protein Com